jgi:hypothetical protein
MVEDVSSCDGQNDQDIIDNNECYVPMETLRDPTKYNLLQGELVVAQVAAYNQKGQG